MVAYSSRRKQGEPATVTQFTRYAVGTVPPNVDDNTYAEGAERYLPQMLQGSERRRTAYAQSNVLVLPDMSACMRVGRAQYKHSPLTESCTAPSSAQTPGLFMSSAPETDLIASCNWSLTLWSTLGIDRPLTAPQPESVADDCCHLPDGLRFALHYSQNRQICRDAAKLAHLSCVLIGAQRRTSAIDAYK